MPAVTDDASLPTIWRTKLRSLKPGVDHQEQVRPQFRGRDRRHRLGHRGVAGRRLPLRRPGGDRILSWLDQGRGSHGSPLWQSRPDRRLHLDAGSSRPFPARTHHRPLPRPKNTELAKRTDTHQVRDCEWASQPLSDLEVPGAVIRGFVGTSTSFSRM